MLYDTLGSMGSMPRWTGICAFVQALQTVVNAQIPDRMRALHLLIDLYPGLQSAAPCNDEVRRTKAAYRAAKLGCIPSPGYITSSSKEPYFLLPVMIPAAFMIGGSVDIAQLGGSILHVQQHYMCKGSHLVDSDNERGVCCTTCAGHKGSWSWNLQKQMWQLQSNQAVLTKSLPRNVLDLADLIGELKCHTNGIALGMEW